jgi:dipeptidyl aminopeptidase/acylaminoacyl peptidase
MKSWLNLLIVLLFAIPLYAQSVLTTDDLTLPVSLSEAKISPGGKTAVFIVTRRFYETNNAKSELVLVDLETGQQKTLSAQQGITEPEWSPTGDRISFLAESAKEGTQIFVLPIHMKEARQITHVKGGILHHTWSPDGTRFALIAQEPSPTKTGPQRFNNAFEVGNNNYLTTEPATSNHVAIVNIADGIVRQITPRGTIVATDFSNSSLSWSMDGTKLAINIYPSSRSGDNDLGVVHLLDVGSGKSQPVTNLKDQMGPGVISQDGNQILFAYPRDGVPANESEVYAVDINGGESKSISRSLDREILQFVSLSSGRVLMSGYEGVKSQLWLFNAGQFSTLDIGDVAELAEFNANKNGTIVFIGDEPHRPSELYYKSSPDAKATRVTSFNQQLVDRKQGKNESFSWKSTNGLEVDGVLTYPPDFSSDKNYPLVLLIHGGPTGISSLGFNMLAQLMATKGWIVFEPNYRGSNGHGNAFQSAIANDAGEGPGADVMSGVEELKKKPFVNPKKIAVSGWSYGGYMTAWMIGRYPDVWAAAVAGAAPVDYTDMYSLSDLNRMRRHAITDSPYKGDNLKSAYEQSPIKNFSKLKTPTLVMSKVADSRVSITGSYKLYNALRDNGIPTQFIAYPGSGHLVTDPVRSKDVYDRWLSWFEKYLSP